MSGLDDLRESQDRDLRRVGIPMILVLGDETGAAESAVDDAVAADGSRLAQRLDQARADLAPTRPDDDLGVVVSLLTLVGYLDRGDDL